MPKMILSTGFASSPTLLFLGFFLACCSSSSEEGRLYKYASDENDQMITTVSRSALAGGVGTAFGALVGAALIEIIRNSLGLLGINVFWQGCFIGEAILVAVLFDRLRKFRQNQ